MFNNAYSDNTAMFSAGLLFDWEVLLFTKRKTITYFFNRIDFIAFYRSSTCKNIFWKKFQPRILNKFLEFRKFKPQFYHKVCSIEIKQNVMMLFGSISVPSFPLEALLELLWNSIMEADFWQLFLCRSCYVIYPPTRKRRRAKRLDSSKIS